MPDVVDVVATVDHLSERLTRALDDGPASSAVAPRTLTWPELVARCLAADPAASVAPADVERLCLAAAVRAVLPQYDPAFTERAGTVEAFARTLDTLRRHDVDAAQLEAAVARTDDRDEGARARLRTLAAVLTEQTRRLRAGGHLGAAEAEYAAARALDATRLAPDALGLAETVRVWHLDALPPARVALLTALSRWLARHRGALHAHVVCEPRRMKLPLTLDRALRAFEAEEGAGLELRFGLRDPNQPEASAPLARLVGALAVGARAGDGDASEARGRVALAEARGPDEEARWVASRIERWIADGVAPHEVAVVLRRAEDDRVDTLGRALDDARIPWVDTRDAPLLASPVARALLGMPRVVARGAEREEVLRALAVLQGNGARGNEPAPWRVADALRAMDVESLFDTRLPELCARARRKNTSAAVLAAVEALARDLWELSQDGTAAEHVARLERWVLRAGGDGRFLEESRTVWPPRASTPAPTPSCAPSPATSAASPRRPTSSATSTPSRAPPGARGA